MPEEFQVIGPDGRPVTVQAQDEQGGDDATTAPSPADLVEQPAKVMRIGGMIRQLLEEVKSAPLDAASRARLREIYEQSVTELKDGLAPELVEELERLSLPFGAEAPTDAELRIAQAQLVGWLEGLFHGIQAAIYAQQVAAQQQLQNIRLAIPGPNAAKQGETRNTDRDGGTGGMYL